MLPLNLMLCVAQVMAGDEGELENTRMYLTNINNGSIKTL